jgi:hypothetical protein
MIDPGRPVKYYYNYKKNVLTPATDSIKTIHLFSLERRYPLHASEFGFTHSLLPRLLSLERDSSPLQLRQQLLHENPSPGHMLVLALPHAPARVAEARSINAAARAPSQPHDPDPCPLPGQHLQKIGIVEDEGPAKAPELRHIQLVSG